MLCDRDEPASSTRRKPHRPLELAEAVGILLKDNQKSLIHILWVETPIEDDARVALPGSDPIEGQELKVSVVSKEDAPLGCCKGQLDLVTLRSVARLVCSQDVVLTLPKQMGEHDIDTLVEIERETQRDLDGRSLL
jgi:hypothetical protein